MTKPQWQKAIEFVKGGGSITAIESKYTITAAEMLHLKGIKTNNNPIHNG